jgi:hypothetical protein
MVLSQTEFVELQNGNKVIESCTIISKYIVLKFIFLLDFLYLITTIGLITNQCIIYSSLFCLPI